MLNNVQKIMNQNIFPYLTKEQKNERIANDLSNLSTNLNLTDMYLQKVFADCRRLELKQTEDLEIILVGISKEINERKEEADRKLKYWSRFLKE